MGRSNIMNELLARLAGPRSLEEGYGLSGRAQIALTVLGALLLAVAQPMIIEPLGETVVDPTGLSGALVFVGWVPFLIAVRGASVKRTFWLACLFLVTKYTVVLYWLIIAMHVFGHIPLVLSFLFLELLCFTIGTGLGATIGASQLMHRHYGVPFWVFFVLAFGGGEFIRNIGPLGGFPWGNDGAALATVPLLLQGASLVGVHGLVVLVLLVNVALAEVFAFVRKKRSAFPTAAVGLAGAGLLITIAWGAHRLSDEPEVVATIKVGLLQGNIDQGIKNKERFNKQHIAERLHALQAEAIKADVDVVVWPEAAVPGTLRLGSKNLRNTSVVDHRGPHRGLVPKAGIIGAAAYEGARDKKTGKYEVTALYNTALVTGPGLKLEGRFDKSHLVPFGEYVPWPFGPIVQQLVPGGRNTPGTSLVPVEVELGGRKTKVAATICYEGLFPEISRAFANQGAEIMFNVTNDAWYGVSSAAPQHFMAYAVRAAETGRPVARAANTGLSGWVDARGRVHDLSRLYTTTAHIVDVPIVAPETTPYMVVGEMPYALFWALGLLFWFIALAGPNFLRRPRSPVEKRIAGLGVGLMVLAHLLHWIVQPPDGDEALTTQHTVYFACGYLLAAGALSGRPWGRGAVMWVGGFAAVFCAVSTVMLVLQGGAAGEMVWALALSAAGAGLWWVAKRRKDHYQRPPETLLEMEAAAVPPAQS